MRPILLGQSIIMIIVVGCGGSPEPHVRVLDAPAEAALCPQARRSSSCNPLTQAGCGDGEKCTWVVDTSSLGHVGCVVSGDVALGGACSYVAVPWCEQRQVDDCEKGLVCTSGICKAICNHQGGQPMCAEGGCVVVEDLFVVSGDVTIAGVCTVSAARSR